VINYGEVKPGSLEGLGLKKGDRVRMGQKIGAVGASKMLHFETYRSGTKKNYQWWVGAQQPSQLMNPTRLLLALAAGKAGRPAAGRVAVAAVSPANENLVSALRGALKLHEIGDKSPYQLFFAGKGKSGASFGFMQGDLASGGSEVTQAFKGVLTAASFQGDRIDSLLEQLSVHLIANPLDSLTTRAVNAALLKSSPLVDAMDGQIFKKRQEQLEQCIEVASQSGRTITPKAQIYIIMWLNMTSPPTNLLKFLSGFDPGLARPVPKAGSTIDDKAMEAYLSATDYYTENPNNFPHIVHCAAAGAAMLYNG